MSYDLNLPKITENSPLGQITELRSYLFQLIGDLNFALNDLERQVIARTVQTETGETVLEIAAQGNPGSTTTPAEETQSKEIDVAELFKNMEKMIGNSKYLQSIFTSTSAVYDVFVIVTDIFGQTPVCNKTYYELNSAFTAGKKIGGLVISKNASNVVTHVYNISDVKKSLTNSIELIYYTEAGYTPGSFGGLNTTRYKIVVSASEIYAEIETGSNTPISDKQATLVSGQNIKTINNQSILGSGNLDVPEFPEITDDQWVDEDRTEFTPTAEQIAIFNNADGFKYNSFIYHKNINFVGSQSMMDKQFVSITRELQGVPLYSFNVFQFDGDKAYVYEHSTTLPVVTGTDDGTNWTSLNIDGKRRNIPQGGGTAPIVTITDDMIIEQDEGTIRVDGTDIIPLMETSNAIEFIFNTTETIPINDCTVYTVAGHAVFVGLSIQGELTSLYISDDNVVQFANAGEILSAKMGNFVSQIELALHPTEPIIYLGYNSYGGSPIPTINPVYFNPNDFGVENGAISIIPKSGGGGVVDISITSGQIGADGSITLTTEQENLIKNTDNHFFRISIPGMTTSVFVKYGDVSSTLGLTSVIHDELITLTYNSSNHKLGSVLGSGNLDVPEFPEITDDQWEDEDRTEFTPTEEQIAIFNNVDVFKYNSFIYHKNINFVGSQSMMDKQFVSITRELQGVPLYSFNIFQFDGDKAYVYEHSTTLPVVTGTDDGTNWTSLNIDGKSRNIPQGGGTAPIVTITDDMIIERTDTQVVISVSSLYEKLFTNGEVLNIAIDVPGFDYSATLLASGNHYFGIGADGSKCAAVYTSSAHRLVLTIKRGETDLPAPPSADGSYTLRLVKNGTSLDYSWVAE